MIEGSVNGHSGVEAPGLGVPVLPPVEPPAASEPAAPRIESRLYEAGLVTADQLGELVHAHATTGRPVEELVLERGLVDLATLRAVQAGEEPLPAATAPAEAPAEPPPAPAAPSPAVANAVPVANVVSFPAAPTPLHQEPVEAAAFAAPESAPAYAPRQPEPAPAPPKWGAEQARRAGGQVSYVVSARLASGHLTHAGRYPDEPTASEASRTLLADLSTGREWVQIGPAFVRPSAIVSLEVHARLAGDDDA